MDEILKDAETLRVRAWTYTVLTGDRKSAQFQAVYDLYLKLSEWKDTFPAK